MGNAKGGGGGGGGTKDDDDGGVPGKVGGGGIEGVVGVLPRSARMDLLLSGDDSDDDSSSSGPLRSSKKSVGALMALDVDLLDPDGGDGGDRGGGKYDEEGTVRICAMGQEMGRRFGEIGMVGGEEGGEDGGGGHERCEGDEDTHTGIESLRRRHPREKHWRTNWREHEWFV